MRRPPVPPDISAVLGRWASALPDLFSSPRFLSVVRDCQDRYRHWDKVRFIARDRGLEPEAVWAAIKSARLSLQVGTGFTDQKGNAQTLLIPARVQRALAVIDRQLRGADSLRPRVALRPDYRASLAAESEMEEAVESSLLEGAATTADVAKDMLRRRRAPTTTAERMIVNNYEAMRFIREHRSHTLTTEMLLEIQAILTQDTMPADQVGRLRTEADRVRVTDAFGEVLHEPPGSASLKGRLERLCIAANGGVGEFQSLHPVVRAVLLHFQIAYEHPFVDGNGRTARAVFYWYALRKGYRLFEYLPISGIIRRAPSAYVRAYTHTESDAFDATYFVYYHMAVIDRARREMWSHAARQQEAISRADKALAIPNLNARQLALLLELSAKPPLPTTIQQHQRRRGVAFATARSDLLALVERGMLEQSKAGNKFQFRISPQAMRVLKGE